MHVAPKKTSSKFSSNFEAKASESLENIVEFFSSVLLVICKSRTTNGMDVFKIIILLEALCCSKEPEKTGLQNFQPHSVLSAMELNGYIML